MSACLETIADLLHFDDVNFEVDVHESFDVPLEYVSAFPGSNQRIMKSKKRIFRINYLAGTSDLVTRYSVYNTIHSPPASSSSSLAKFPTLFYPSKLYSYHHSSQPKRCSTSTDRLLHDPVSTTTTSTLDSIKTFHPVFFPLFPTPSLHSVASRAHWAEPSLTAS